MARRAPSSEPSSPVSGYAAPIDRPRRERRTTRPPSTKASARSPSHLNSNVQPGPAGGRLAGTGSIGESAFGTGTSSFALASRTAGGEALGPARERPGAAPPTGSVAVSARPHAPGPPRLRRLIGSRIRAGTSSLAAPTTAPVRPGTSL